MSKVITKKDTEEMAGYRQENLQYDFPQLKSEDYADETAYRQALVEQYQALRQQEFSYVVRNEAMKAYNVSSEANKHKGFCNTTNGAWGGYGARPEARDSSFVNVRRMVDEGNTPNSGESCAISANALTLKISEEMGYTGKNNLIVPKDRSKFGYVRNNLSSAQLVHKQDSIPENCRVDYINKTPKPTLNEAIKKGIVEAGDEISIVTGTASGNRTSGCHAMVVVDVCKDQNGKVTNYTLQGNNPPTLVNVDANKPDYYGKRPLNSATKTSKWIKDKVAKEIPSGMSIEDLEAKVATTKGRVSETVSKLQSTEQYYAEHKHYNDSVNLNNAKSYGFGERYNSDLAVARDISQAKIKPIEPAQIQPTDDGLGEKVEQQLQQMRNQIGELPEDKEGREGATVALKAGPVDKGVAYREAKKELDKADERSVPQVMKDGHTTAQKTVPQYHEVKEQTPTSKKQQDVTPVNQNQPIPKNVREINVNDLYNRLKKTR